MNKRFTETVSTGIVTDNLTGKEYNCEMRINDQLLELTMQVTIAPVFSTREITYDISKFIKAYLDMGKTEEEAREDFKKILEEVVEELSEMEGFKNDCKTMY